MIVRALPISVPHLWTLVKPGVVNTISRISTSPDKATAEILKRCCAGAMQLWLIGDVENEDFSGFFLTELSSDLISGGKSLHIYMFYLFKSLTPELIKEGQEALTTFAREYGCAWITFLSEEINMAAAAEKWWPGWDIRPFARRSVE